MNEIDEIARRLIALTGKPMSVGIAANSTECNCSAFHFHTREPLKSDDQVVRAARLTLPDPRLVRSIIQQRKLRDRYLDHALFADPAWDMLLDLTAARAEHRRVSVTSLCIASCVPPTTALRWIGQMTDAGLLRRTEDVADRRRAFIELTDRAAEAMARYFAKLGDNSRWLV